MQTLTPSGRIPRKLLITILLCLVGIVTALMLPVFTWSWLAGRIPTFATIFLGIFIEAAPFLLLGTLGSGIVEVYFDQEKMFRIFPRNGILAALLGSLFGLVFPVCECGVVPLTRRLFRKGLPISAGIAFLLAAPVLNPIVIFSTASAFGWGQILLLRLVLSLGIAFGVGLIFAVEKDPMRILRPVSGVEIPQFIPKDLKIGHKPKVSKVKAKIAGPAWTSKLRRVLEVSADEFFEMGRYLVMGAALAAALQALVPQSSLLSIGQGPITSVIAMIVLAVVLSICSTVDAFVALGFAGTFSAGSILAFLVFGPMVDIKSVLMYLQVFRPRVVVYLVFIPLLMSILAGIFINYYLP